MDETWVHHIAGQELFFQESTENKQLELCSTYEIFL